MVQELVNDAREGRTDEEALVWLAEMVVLLSTAASVGYLRARTGETPTLKLDDKEPVT